MPKPSCYSQNSLDPLYWDGRLARATRPTGVPQKFAFAHLFWHFIIGKPWDSTTIIAKKPCLGSTRRFHCLVDQRFCSSLRGKARPIAVLHNKSLRILQNPWRASGYHFCRNPGPACLFSHNERPRVCHGCAGLLSPDLSEPCGLSKI